MSSKQFLLPSLFSMLFSRFREANLNGYMKNNSMLQKAKAIIRMPSQKSDICIIQNVLPHPLVLLNLCMIMSTWRRYYISLEFKIPFLGKKTCNFLTLTISKLLQYNLIGHLCSQNSGMGQKTKVDWTIWNHEGQVVSNCLQD